MYSKVVSLALIALLSIAVVRGDDPDFNNPRRSAEEDLVTSLPGLDPHSFNFKHYSGYLKADTVGDKYFHYWFVESQSDPKNDPILLWLNGGPGCSSMLGMFTELGPFRLNSDGKTLYNNGFSWNKLANVLFVESPAGVGFSYSIHSNNTSNDDTTATSNHLVLKDFFEKFPQFKSNKLYLSGESYGGMYLPTLGVLVDADKDLNLHGIAIGNGYLHPDMLAQSLVLFTYYHGLYGETLWKQLSKECCDGKAPSREDCSFTSPDRSQACGSAVMLAADAILSSGLNPYNLYDTCHVGSGSRSSRQHSNSLMRTILAQFDSNNTVIMGKRSKHVNRRESKDKMLVLHSLGLHEHNGLLRSLRDTPPCTDDSLLTNYFAIKAVRKAMHIPKELRDWEECSDIISYTMQYPTMAPQMKSLIGSARNLTMLVYNGDIDMMCNFLGDEFFCDSLGLTVVSDYQPWKVDGQIAGYRKKYQGLEYRTIRGAGHMVPTDKAAEAFSMIKDFFDGGH